MQRYLFFLKKFERNSPIRSQDFWLVRLCDALVTLFINKFWQDFVCSVISVISQMSSETPYRPVESSNSGNFYTSVPILNIWYVKFCKVQHTQSFGSSWCTKMEQANQGRNIMNFNVPWYSTSASTKNQKCDQKQFSDVPAQTCIFLNMLFFTYKQ